jgi:hypothetical protein
MHSNENDGDDVLHCGHPEESVRVHASYELGILYNCKSYSDS